MAQAEPADIMEKRSKLKSHASLVAKFMKGLEIELSKSDRIDMIHLRELFDDFSQVWSVYEQDMSDLGDFSETDQLDIRNTFDRLYNEYEHQRPRVRQLLANERSPRSQVGKSVSGASSRSSRRRQLAEQKLVQVQRRQELERKEQVLRQQQEEIRRQVEVQNIKDELENAAVEDDLSSENSDYASDRKQDLPNEQTSARQKVEEYVRTLPPFQSDVKPPEAVPFSRDTNVDLYNGFKKLTDSVQESLNLPKPELLSFNGNPSDYCKFISNFETNIESRVKDDRLRLSYLIQYCQGDARRSVEDCVVLPSDQGYPRAKQILHQRYGKSHLIARSFVDKLVNSSAIKPNDVEGLMNLALDMQKCQMTLSQMGFSSDVNNSENLKKIVRRLPMHIRSKWVEKASSIIDQGLEPNFDDLLAFVHRRASVANTMYGLDLATESKASHVSKQKLRSESSKRGKFVTLSTTASSSENTSGSKIPADRYDTPTQVIRLSCVYCKEGHKLIDCSKFKLADLSQRFATVRKHRMCENCLNFKHTAKYCRKGSNCSKENCNEKHHTLLHETGKAENAGQSNCCATLDTSTGKVCLRIVPVTVCDGLRSVDTYALLDEGSDVTLCSDALVHKLGAKGKQREFILTTVNQSTEKRHGLELKLKVGALNCYDTIALERVWSVEKLPISLKSLPSNEEVSKWKHLSDIDLPRIHEGQVELLIGSDTPDAFWVQEERRGASGEPYAIRSVLGWSVLGPIGKTGQSSSANVNFQQISDTQIDLERLWKNDFPECRSDNIAGMSQADKRALSLMDSTIELDDGHYQLGIPWRNEHVSLQNNKVMAVSRLSSLKRKLEKDESLYSSYNKTMTDYIDKGYASVVDAQSERPGKVWYLPHHPVINPKKQEKVRIVFDCAAKYRGESLNDKILQGPDLTNSIVGVLIRFRQEPIAIVADIESMFHQVKVSEGDRDALRFLWWPDGDMSKQPIEYRMNVHLFGATSSPSCAAYSLRRTATDNADAFSNEVVTSIQRNFYVDDLLKSVIDIDRGIRLSAELRDILSLGGFRLRKWLSNSSEVMATIPESEKAKTSDKVSIESDTQLERALGLQWCVDSDRFVFEVSLKEKSQTRRGILSVASSLYDPLGLVAPVTIIPKLVLQNACRQKLQWDDQLLDGDVDTWTHWLQSVPELSKVSIDRCLKPDQLDMSTSMVELHMFSDASEYAYGSAVYSKIYDIHGNTKCSLVLGKSRLAPIKAMSIPRLELAAAALSVKLYMLVIQELEFVVHRKYFWTDSMIVLGYINNEEKPYKTFVANRLAVIHDVTSPKDWRYVPTKLNPADLASRGVHPYETAKLDTWLNGPSFLKDDSSQWPKLVSVRVQNDDDVELKSVHTTQIKKRELLEDGLNRLLVKYSDWYKLQRAVAWLLRFKALFIGKYRKKDLSQFEFNCGNLTVAEIRKATEAILMMSQKDAFGTDIKSILDTGRVTKVSQLNKLSPVYKDNLLRVGGRLQNADLRSDMKHPVILPSDHHVTKVIIRKYHELNAHMGVNYVLSLLRQKFWIIHGLKTVKSVLSRCIDCKKRHPRPEVQQMGQLPAERLTPDKPPFTYVGVDYFGPMYVKMGRKHLKRYGCLFTCLTTRAVHLEIAHSLDTDSFISALQRFVNRRGHIEVMYSDNGTNLKAGEREIRESIQSWNQSRISKFLTQHETEWNFIPPYASHMGGVWERMVRSVKTAFKSVLKEQLLNDEALLTLATEVEKILNDRPITQISDDPRDPEALTPSKLLLLRANSCVPPGIFNPSDNYCKRWWRQVQYLANIFWRRWTREYIPSLQVRQKWENIRRNLSVNDLVLVCDETTGRGQWPLGRILEVKTGRDGLVRSCRVKVNGSEKLRPISKLCLLEQHVE